MIIDDRMLLFRNLRVVVGVALVFIGLGGLAGNQAGVIPSGSLNIEGPSAWMAILIGAVLLVSLLFDMRRANRGRPEQKWEPVADEGFVSAINGKWDEAMSHFERAMSMAWPEPRRLRAAELIGGYLEDRGRLADAALYLRDALALRERMFGPFHDSTQNLRNHVSDLYLNLGDGASAADLLRRQLDHNAPSGHVISLDSAKTASRLARALQMQGDLNAAQEASQKAIAAIQSSDPYSPELVDALVVSADFAAATGDHSKGEEMLKRAMECADRVGNDQQLQLVREHLLNLYLAAGRYPDAVPLSEKVLAGRARSTKNADISETARLNRQHAELLEKAQRPEDAKKFQRVAETLERLSQTSVRATGADSGRGIS